MDHEDRSIQAPFDYGAGLGTLSSDGWLEWNMRNTGFKAERVKYLPGDGSSLEGVLYTDRRGRVRMPRLNPYLPFTFSPVGVQKPERMARQWDAVASLLAEDLVKRKVVGRISLPPAISDGRPFRWAGLTLETQYTFVGHVPHDLREVSAATRKNFNKAERMGYRFETGVEASEVVPCLQSTGVRQGFDYRLTERSLKELQTLLPATFYRAHAVRDPAGQVVSAGVRLITPEGVALDWVQGTQADVLSHGVVQFMYRGALSDMEESGAHLFDFGGANIRAVAKAKAAWGMPLVPYLTLGQDDARRLYSVARGTLRRGVSYLQKS